MRSVLLFAALAACSGETAIVLEIHKAPGVSSEVKALHVYAGVGHDDDLIDARWWVAADLDESEAVVQLEEEMGATTYRYLVRPGGGLDVGGELMFAVAGYKNLTDDEPVVFGHSASAVRFGDGEVRVYDFPLVTFASANHGVAASGCAWWDDEGLRMKRDAITPRDDGDCDSYTQDNDAEADCMLDCADRDPQIHPGQTEICADNIDQNCCDDDDGRVDLDGDTFSACGAPPTDCVDLPPGTEGPRNVFGVEVPSAQINPAADEICDGLDNDCSGVCDNGEFDPDGDGYFNCRGPNGSDELKGVHRVSAEVCEGSDLDCLEVTRPGAPPPATFHPGASDLSCDTWDQNCDGECDEAAVELGDQDMDGFPFCTTDGGYLDNVTPQCARGTGADCGGDDLASEFPGPAERCDGLDFDCDLEVFPALSPCFVVEGSGQEATCVVGRRPCDDQPGGAGFGACTHDVNGPRTPLPMEWCNNLACAQQGTDLIQCITEVDAQCAVPFNSALALQPCTPPPADIPLPDDQGTGGCTYLLVGGGTQGDWQVTLFNPTSGQTGPTVMGCDTVLRITSARPDAEDRVVMVLSGIAPHPIRLRRQNQCNAAGQGILCAQTGP